MYYYLGSSGWLFPPNILAPKILRIACNTTAKTTTNLNYVAARTQLPRTRCR
eukprot:SAG31_NODE_6829_length_1875_cov_4.819820_1_plen_51_part_10